ncbi:unnamed protein product [Prorocentrum cordatum]|uniref:Uncharacterized protein n=1 Tax=Prorocentrum cordatum TaxID=2364126 RepID=A0ABN9XX17_9DINO|nr:unnamed protein product [Polarella glacialis]
MPDFSILVFFAARHGHGIHMCCWTSARISSEVSAYTTVFRADCPEARGHTWAGRRARQSPARLACLGPGSRARPALGAATRHPWGHSPRWSERGRGQMPHPPSSGARSLNFARGALAAVGDRPLGPEAAVAQPLPLSMGCVVDSGGLSCPVSAASERGGSE